MIKFIRITFLKICVLSIVLIAISSFLISPVNADEFLNSGEVAGIAGATMGLSYFGYTLRGMDTTRTPLIDGPLPLDIAMKDIFGGRYYKGKTNFLDNKFGSAITPVTTSALLVIANLSYSKVDKEKETLQDLFLFTSGLITTKGITDLSKGIFTRPRPYKRLPTDEQRVSHGFKTDRSSFISGHTSGAFFSAAYLNLRMRSIMRSEMTLQEYKDWRWAPPTILFSWASTVGFSRIHSYKHYFSDIVFGALAGYLIAELFYSFGNKYIDSYSENSESKMIFRLQYKF